MYGFLIKAAVAYLQLNHLNYSRDILEDLGFSEQKDLDQFQIYSDKLFGRISKMLSEKTGEAEDALMEKFGEYAIEYMCKSGYQDLLYSLGRSLSDLLNELDNLHEYIKMSYPKIKPPSFICLKESVDGITLLYRSKRKGFQTYIMGLLRNLSLRFYGTTTTIEISTTRDSGDKREVVYRLFFDNSSRYSHTTDVIMRDTYFKNKVILADSIFEIYPFHILLSDTMEILSVGQGIKNLYSKVLREDFSSLFEIVRPNIEPNFRTIQHHLNNIFEVSCLLSPKGGDLEQAAPSMQAAAAGRRQTVGGGNLLEQPAPSNAMMKTTDSTMSSDADLLIKGQMIYIEEWNTMLFVGFPLLVIPEQMLRIGLYVSDLSLFDSSRDLIMVASQDQSDKSMTQKLLSVKTDVVAEATHITEKTKEDWQRIHFALLPNSVSQKMIRGEPAYSLATNFNRATVIYIEVIDERFDSLLGEVFAHIEDIHRDAAQVCSKFDFYKVDGRLTEFMLLCGVPDHVSRAEINACVGALALLSNAKIALRVGIATGPLAAGVIGVKLLAYKPFGEAVKVSRALANKAEARKILVDDTTANACVGEATLTFEPGPEVRIHEKGHPAKTFWVKKVSGKHAK